ncbi:hypothetical protein vBBak6_073 [Bacillus phage v_B-Bak6]|uniref:Uncharacterized protein n=1 Tax=Bacillus phage Basilisk TaxID=1296654 RepID=S5M453_9CAUD|nr:hypothetical protein PP653_gp085 [Bacillus phage Basilisk]AGR46626.1 hypothetical protein BASILISK_82 [Bacillus phage Basilisk]AXY83033.1 hypothetical protein vBBak1_073 [Bacillus phage v_B-Bak1]AXY83153.1 hypothetical protein vBBak6_073 [Bacillus phage v_B-Bak6]
MIVNNYYVKCCVGSKWTTYELEARNLTMLEGIINRIQYDKSKPVVIELVQLSFY